ncbi:DNA cytosine methyltransferase [Streptomyces sp. UP1A-1]|nr:DNA cytosine methyltransferase [Streptomyces sp. UP1A-1]
MRWHYDLRPEWIAMEEVPAVLPLWRQYARILTAWGYSVWCGVLNAADYGLGQARRRAVLIASRVRRVGRPEATHYDPRKGDQLWGEPWVTMADALGWGYTDRPSAHGDRRRHGDRRCRALVVDEPGGDARGNGRPVSLGMAEASPDRYGDRRARRR